MRVDQLPDGLLEKRSRFLVRRKQRLDFFAHAGIRAGEELFSFGTLALTGLVKELANLFPEARGHSVIGRHLTDIARRSQARAIVHSRLMVAAETPSTAAVSSMVSPA
jgi:hypothetical protein